jgi:hypothetical protein
VARDENREDLLGFDIPILPTREKKRRSTGEDMVSRDVAEQERLGQSTRGNNGGVASGTVAPRSPPRTYGLGGGKRMGTRVDTRFGPMANQEHNSAFGVTDVLLI